MICKNCGNDFEGKFCNNCGQKADIHRFTLKHAIHDFIHVFTHVDKGILFLMKELTLRPGFVAREYIEGKRKKYFSPMQYLVLAVAVSAFITIKFGIIGYRDLPPDIYSALSQQQKFFLQFNNFVYTYFNLTLFAAVPVMAFFSRLIYFKSGFNYSENLVFNTFIAAQRTLLYIVISPFLYVFREKWYIGIGTYYILFCIYSAYAFIQFFKGNKINSLLRFIFVFILSFSAMQAITMFVFYLFFYKP
jgi:hypothetical protein